MKPQLWQVACQVYDMAQFGTVTNQEGTLRCHEPLLFLSVELRRAAHERSGLPLHRNCDQGIG